MLPGPLFDVAEGGVAASDAPEPAHEAEAVGDLPPPGEMADPAAAAADDGGDAGGGLRRLNENIEQLLDEMGGYGADSEKTRSLLESLQGAGIEKPVAANAAPPRETAPVPAADLHRWIEADRRRRRRWAGVAAAAAAPAALLLGLLVEQQFQVIPLHDPTGGWGGHIWDNYGRTIVDCAVEAMRTNAEVDCPLAVRRP